METHTADANAVNVDVQVDDVFAPVVDVGAVEGAAQRAVATIGVQGAAEISVLVTDDESLRELNRTYRGVDKATDVLSFGQDGADMAGWPEDAPRMLGDVVISYPRVVEQAQKAGWQEEDELLWLVIHGVLHLLGYDDEDEDGRAEMWTLGELILGKPAPGGPTE
ncbi:MAG: rRNA maturation RNase YbeY [Anaerolineae bacterium]